MTTPTPDHNQSSSPRTSLFGRLGGAFRAIRRMPSRALHAMRIPEAAAWVGAGIRSGIRVCFSLLGKGMKLLWRLGAIVLMPVRRGLHIVAQPLLRVWRPVWARIRPHLPKRVLAHLDERKKRTHRRMTMQDVFALSTRTFKTRPLRTTLTILGMSVGIGAVLFLVSLGYGLQETVLNRITTTDALLSLDVSAESELIVLNNESLDRISALPHVAEVSPIAAIPSQITLGDVTGVVTMYAINPSYFNLSGLTAGQGTLFTAEETDTQPKLVVSAAMATLFNIPADDILGRTVYITGFISTITEDDIEEVAAVEVAEPFTIVGVIEDDKESFMYASREVLPPELHGSTFISTKVKVDDAAFMSIVRDQIIDMGFFVSVLQDTIDQVKKIFTIIQVVLGLFGLVALIVSAIGMFNTMTVMLLERTNEIGIMSSIGVTKRDIKKLFLFEAMLMGFLGGLGGVILGHLGGILANFGINLLANNFGGQALNLFARPTSFLVIIIVFSTVIGFATGIFPARRAGKLKTLDALRYK